MEIKKHPIEEDIPNPTGVYGQTKLDGEKAIQETWDKHFIIRTSWVYSQFGNNFMKTMLRLASERDKFQ
jgi:dTDP-4-dehydrorhamnose reductase